jgi:opacity protein-like surface antigen
MNARTIRRLAWTAATAGVLAVAISGPAAAGTYYRKGTFALAGGFNFPTGEAANYLNSSGSMMIAGGRNLNQKMTLQIEWNHHWLGIDPAVIDRASSDSVQFDNAYASMWSMTLNGIYRFNPNGDAVPWVTGGFGYYKRNLQLTQNTMVYWPPIWDPWWGWVDGGWGPGEAISGKRESSGIGFNVGAGLDLEIENGACLFIDVRYHYAPMDGVDLTLVPVMAGVRW